MTSPPTSPASTGHDPVDDAAFIARVQRQRERDRFIGRTARRFFPAVLGLAVVVTIGGVATTNFLAFNCRSYGAEARNNLQRLDVAQRAFHAEHGRFSIDRAELAWAPDGHRLRYTYFLRADADRYEAVAVGAGPSLAGDLWRSGNSGHSEDRVEIEHLVDGCR